MEFATDPNPPPGDPDSRASLSEQETRPTDVSSIETSDPANVNLLSSSPLSLLENVDFTEFEDNFIPVAANYPAGGSSPVYSSSPTRNSQQVGTEASQDEATLPVPQPSSGRSLRQRAGLESYNENTLQAESLRKAAKAISDSMPRGGSNKKGKKGGEAAPAAKATPTKPSAASVLSSAPKNEVAHQHDVPAPIKRMIASLPPGTPVTKELDHYNNVMRQQLAAQQQSGQQTARLYNQEQYEQRLRQQQAAQMYTQNPNQLRRNPLSNHTLGTTTSASLSRQFAQPADFAPISSEDRFTKGLAQDVNKTLGFAPEDGKRNYILPNGQFIPKSNNNAPEAEAGSEQEFNANFDGITQAYADANTGKISDGECKARVAKIFLDAGMQLAAIKVLQNQPYTMADLTNDQVQAVIPANTVVLADPDANRRLFPEFQTATGPNTAPWGPRQYPPGSTLQENYGSLHDPRAQRGQQNQMFGGPGRSHGASPAYNPAPASDNGPSRGGMPGGMSGGMSGGGMAAGGKDPSRGGMSGGMAAGGKGLSSGGTSGGMSGDMFSGSGNSRGTGAGHSGMQGGQNQHQRTSIRQTWDRSQIRLTDLNARFAGPIDNDGMDFEFLADEDQDQNPVSQGNFNANSGAGYFQFGSGMNHSFTTATNMQDLSNLRDERNPGVYGTYGHSRGGDTAQVGSGVGGEGGSVPYPSRGAGDMFDGAPGGGLGSNLETPAASTLPHGMQPHSADPMLSQYAADEEAASGGMSFEYEAAYYQARRQQNQQ